MTVPRAIDYQAEGGVVGDLTGRLCTMGSLGKFNRQNGVIGMDSFGAKFNLENKEGFMYAITLIVAGVLFVIWMVVSVILKSMEAIIK